MKAIIIILIGVLVLQSCVEKGEQKIQRAVSVLKVYKEEERVKDSIENIFLIADPQFIDHVIKANGIESLDENYRRKYFRNKAAYDLLLVYDSILSKSHFTKANLEVACDDIRDKRISDSLIVSILHPTTKD